MERRRARVMNVEKNIAGRLGYRQFNGNFKKKKEI